MPIAWTSIQVPYHLYETAVMGLLPDTQNCGLRMRRECRKSSPWHRLQRKLLDSDPSMYHGTCVTHVPRCMSGSLTCGGGENVPGLPGACATHNFTYLARGPLFEAMVTRGRTIWILDLPMDCGGFTGRESIEILASAMATILSIFNKYSAIKHAQFELLFVVYANLKVFKNW